MSRELKNELSKERILKAAIEEFGNHDYATASTNRICKNHGISKGLLFHYYTTKDEIFLVCTQKCIDEIVDYLQVNYSRGEGAWLEHINRYLQVRYEFFKAYPELGRIFRTIIFNPPPHLKEIILVQKSKLYALNKKILLEIIEGLALKTDLSKEKAVTLILEFADYLLVKENPQEEDFEHFLEVKNQELLEMIQILFYGMLK